MGLNLSIAQKRQYISYLCIAVFWFAHAPSYFPQLFTFTALLLEVKLIVCVDISKGSTKRWQFYQSAPNITKPCTNFMGYMALFPRVEVCSTNMWQCTPHVDRDITKLTIFESLNVLSPKYFTWLTVSVFEFFRYLLQVNLWHESRFYSMFSFQISLKTFIPLGC